jgi:hypothetical protein
MPEAGFVLAVLPLFVAWRSLTTYFYFVALPSVALLLARLNTTNAAPAPQLAVRPSSALPASGLLLRRASLALVQRTRSAQRPRP